MKTAETRLQQRRSDTGYGVPGGRGEFEPPCPVVVLLACALAFGCGGTDEPQAPAASAAALVDSQGVGVGDGARLVDREAFADAFDVVRTLVLEEDERAIAVLPMVSSGGPGRFLVAEPREGQVNVYGTDGRLWQVLGSRGEGPGEFMLPISARRTSDGGIVVADMALSRLTFFPPGGGGEPEVVASPLPLVLGADDLGEGRYLLSGQLMSGTQPLLLHLWHRGSDRIEHSFLPMGVPERSRAYAASYTSVATIPEGDTIWAVWALSDTVYKFNRRGERLARIPLSLPRPMGVLPDAGAGVVTDPRAIQADADALTQVTGIFIAGDGYLAVQSMQSRGADAVWDLTIVDRWGAPVWKAAGMPRLFAVEEGLFYFDDFASILPNRWIVARWKGEG
ncbi:MAG: hypothetical protein OXU64_04525 [Gemmatimonadota bacterium]|nr:hypothetical protein [Gemmatimonadota bacterium]